MAEHIDDMREIPRAVSHQLTYFDGSRRVVYCKDEEYELPNGVIIMSRTDPDGLILNGNQAFLDATGYSVRELQNRPYYLLRHPQMPRAIFKEMWEKLNQGKEWNGYIKNLRKDGSFYWAVTHIVPDINKKNEIVYFICTQRKMQRGLINQQETIYNDLRAREEKGFGFDFFGRLFS